ncbi:hypothetical protein LJC59_01940 [Desulfovibrio sp. OttesenSCG-928-A18]|nr:hypothetical protein [Desulfovibrio sp. OttesenSCG-928-A18]
MNAKTLLPSSNSLFSLKSGNVGLAVFGFMALCLCFPDIAAASAASPNFPAPWNGW